MLSKCIIAGGNVVLLYASKYHDICVVVNVSRRYNLKRGIAERFGEDFMQRLKENGYIEVKDKNGNLMFFLWCIVNYIYRIYMFM